MESPNPQKIHRISTHLVDDIHQSTENPQKIHRISIHPVNGIYRSTEYPQNSVDKIIGVGTLT